MRKYVVVQIERLSRVMKVRSLQREKMMRLPFIIMILCISIFLIACTKTNENLQEPDSESKQGNSEPAEQNSGQEEPDTTEDESDEEAKKSEAPIECEGIVLETNAVIEGEKLADCLVAAMLHAGTGTHRVESTGTPAAVIDFQWNPEFALNVKEGPESVIIKGDTGWYKNEAGKWIQEDSQTDDMDSVIANAVIKSVRVFSSPLMMREYWAKAPTWKVVGEESVPASDALTDVAWHLVPEAPIQLGEVTLTDVELFITSNYLGVYSESTGTVGGFTTTTSNTFLQWGEEVIIPEPQ